MLHSLGGPQSALLPCRNYNILHGRTQLQLSACNSGGYSKDWCTPGGEKSGFFFIQHHQDLGKPSMFMGSLVKKALIIRKMSSQEHGFPSVDAIVRLFPVYLSFIPPYYFYK